MSDPALAIAVPLIAEFEGFSAIPYMDCGRGIWTIGYGFTYTEDGKPVSADTPPMTKDAALLRLSSIVARVVAAVRAMVHVPISNNAAAALSSFAFNEGTGALRTSTMMGLLNAGNATEAAKRFDGWVYAGGHILPGLVKRRAAEKALFLRPDITGEQK